MLNAEGEVQTSEERMKVLEGIQLDGRINVEEEEVVRNVQHSIRLGYPQVRPQQMNTDRVCLVGSGPSLESTEKELVDLIFSGAKLVTVNGAYHWCIEHNLRPQSQIVLDARPDINARFLQPEVPNCNYVLSSQCHASTWAAVKGRPNVWIFHGPNPETRDILDKFYLGNWIGISGGTTVTMRAISILRVLGYLRFDLFGIDSCWMKGKHHAIDQPENAGDKCYRVLVSPTGHPELTKKFLCAPWHVKQFEDFLQMIRLNGEHFLLNVHGDGLLASALETTANLAELEWSVKE